MINFNEWLKEKSQELFRERNQKIMELHAQGSSYREIAEWLEENGHGKITRQRVGDIVRRESQKEVK